MPPKSKRFSLHVGYNIWPSSSTTNQNAALIIDPQDPCTSWILLISVSRLRSSADILVLGPQQTQRITGNALRVSFHPDGQINNGKSITGQSGRVLKSWYTGEGPEQGFWRPFADRLARV